MKLTNRSIKAFELGKRTRAELIDDGFRVQGVRLRLVVGRRTKTWVARCEVRGLGRRSVTLGHYADDAPPGFGLTVEDARKAAGKIAALVERGIDPSTHERADTARARVARAKAAAGAVTFEQMAAAWVEWAKTPKTDGGVVPRRKEWAETERILRKDVMPLLGPLPLGEVTQDEIRVVLTEVLDRGAPVQANRTKSAISTVLQLAQKRGLLDVNPARDMLPIGDEDGRTHHRALSWDETLRVWREAEAAATIGGLCWMWSLLTMQRPEVIYSAMRSELADGWWQIPADRVAQVDGEDVFIGGQKAGMDFSIYMGTPLGQLLVERCLEVGGESRWLFPSPARRDRPIVQPRKMIVALREPAGVPDLTMRQARSTAATLAVEVEGIDEKAVSRVLHHRQPGVPDVTQAYIQAAARRPIQKTLTRWHAELAQRLEAELGGKVLQFPG